MGTPNAGISKTLDTNLIAHYTFDSDISPTLDSSGLGNHLQQLSEHLEAVVDLENKGKRLKMLLGDHIQTDRIANTFDKGTTISLWFDYESGKTRPLFKIRWFKSDDTQTGEDEVVEIPVGDGVIKTNFGGETIGTAIEGLNNLIITTGNSEITDAYASLNGVYIPGVGFSLPPDNWSYVQLDLDKTYGSDPDYYDEIRIYDGVPTETQALEIFNMGINYQEVIEGGNDMRKDIVINIADKTAAVTQAVFGVPLIFADNKAIERTVVTSASDLQDGTDEQVVKMVNAIFSQSPAPEKVIIAGALCNDAAAITTALTALLNAEDSFYFVLSTDYADTVTGARQAIADWALANKKIACILASDTAANIVTLAGSLTNERCILIGDDVANEAQRLDASLIGKMAPKTPGSATWKFKTLSGMAINIFTSTELTSLDTANVMTYVRKYGVNQTSEGKMTDGTYIDIVQAKDYLEAKITEEIASVFVNNDKVAFDMTGINQLVAALRKAIENAGQKGIIAKTDAGELIYTINAPKMSDISTADKANRILKGIEFKITIAGAVHKVEIDGALVLEEVA